MPFAMCVSTGFVPQWYMNTPGSFARNAYETDWRGSTSPNALLGATRAAWKSTECGIAPSFVNVTFTSCPWRTWITGPGAPPAQAQAAYLTPGATWMVMSVSARFTVATGPGGAAGRSAG